MTKGKALAWIAGMVASVGIVTWCEIDNRKREKELDEYWRKQREALNKAQEQTKALTEYFQQQTVELQKGIEELCSAEVICPDIVAELKAEGKWLETAEDGYRYFTE